MVNRGFNRPTPLDRSPAVTPPPATSWWAVPMTREQFDAEHAKQVQRMLAVSTTQHVQRREGDA